MKNKYCFTIYYTRTADDIEHYYQKMVQPGLFQGTEIFFPYQLDEEGRNSYRNCLTELYQKSTLDKVLHLPHGKNNNLANETAIDATLKRMKEAIDFAHLFGIKKLTIHPGEIEPEKSFEEAMNNSIRNIRDLADYCAPFGMNLMVENMNGRPELCVYPEEMLFFLKAVNRPNVKAVLDTGHAHVARQDLRHFVLTLKDYLYHTHLSDNDQTRDAHGPIGSGTIDFGLVLRALKEIGYQGLLCLEVLHQKGEELVPLALALEKLTE